MDANLVSGNASGSSATAANWSPAGPAAGTGNTADFTTLTLTTNAVITLDGNQTIGNVSFSSAQNLYLNPGSGGTLTMSVSSGTPTFFCHQRGYGGERGHCRHQRLAQDRLQLRAVQRH